MKGQLSLLLVAMVMLGTAYSLAYEREARGAPKYQMGNVRADTINNYRNKRAANDLQLDQVKVPAEAADQVQDPAAARTARDGPKYRMENVHAETVNNYREKRQKYQMGNVQAGTINNYRNKRAVPSPDVEVQGPAQNVQEGVRTARENVYPIGSIHAGIVNNYREKRQKYQMGNVRADTISNYKRE